ncbi:unnamed protein product [Rotaria magnacalcarata]|uniref:VWFA domain-containing protein n=5 Tax=Rotaria magnacalcarata TaxID=392030 RepID=A0A816W473_9BILA|nr:unnamed protein product [Rotaria magnacalcarata]
MLSTIPNSSPENNVETENNAVTKTFAGTESHIKLPCSNTLQLQPNALDSKNGIRSMLAPEVVTENSPISPDVTTQQPNATLNKHNNISNTGAQENASSNSLATLPSEAIVSSSHASKSPPTFTDSTQSDSTSSTRSPPQTADSSSENSADQINKVESPRKSSVTLTSFPVPTDGNAEPEKVISEEGNPTLSIVKSKKKSSANSSASKQQNSEFELVRSCIPLHILKNGSTSTTKKFELKDLVQAGELIYTEKSLTNILEDALKAYQNHKSFSQLVCDLLITIMYLLKRQQNLTAFMRTLYSLGMATSGIVTDKSLLKILSKISLRMLIDILLRNSDALVCRVIMSLLSRQNPAPLINLATEETKILPQIYHLWDTTTPTVLSFGVGLCPGKSSLLKKLFMSSFEEHQKSIYFQNTIDIDFGYNFIDKRQVNVADTHGEPTKQLILDIHHLFEGFLIQVTHKFAQDNANLISDLLNALHVDKFKMLIIRDFIEDKDSSDSDESSDDSAADQPVVSSTAASTNDKFLLPNVPNLNLKDQEHLINKLRSEIFNKLLSSSKGVEFLANSPRAMQEQKSKTITKLMNDSDRSAMDNGARTIYSLKSSLLDASSKNSEYGYPVYSLFVKYRKTMKELTKITFYGARSNEMLTLQSESVTFDQKLKKTKGDRCGVIFDDFVNLVQQDSRLMNLDILSAELKRSKNLFLRENEFAGDISIEKVFSLEVLWRNAIVCYQYQIKRIQEVIKTSYQQYIEAGFPFEIVDGDNFYLHHEFLSCALSLFARKRVLVISIIGPQNSGKSTLLNYMFGTLFDVRNGRCTRGIYGSLAKSNSKDFDYIMIIDTEGLSSGEKGDLEYDRRIVLFCLAVSHLVIVNVTNLTSELNNLVTLCAHSLQNIGVSRVPEPMVHFVINQQQGKLDGKKDEKAMESLLENLTKHNLQDVIKITKETFHALPLAYKSERLCEQDKDSPNAVRTLPNFIEVAQLLCGTLMSSAKTCFEKSKTIFSDPEQWLDFAKTIFDILLKFPDLTYFTDIYEKTQDDEIRNHIRHEIENKLPPERLRKLVNDTCKLSEKNLQLEVNSLFGEIYEGLDKYLSERLKIIKASATIRTRATEFFNTQYSGLKKAWEITALQANDKERSEELWHTGGDELRQLVENMIKHSTNETYESAVNKFEDMWQNKINSINEKFNREERLHTAIKFIYPNYHSIEKTNLIASTEILKLLRPVQDMEQLDLLKLKEEMRTIFIEQIFKYSSITDNDVVHSQITQYTESTFENFIYLNSTLLKMHLTNFEKQHRSNISTVTTWQAKSEIPKDKQKSSKTSSKHGTTQHTQNKSQSLLAGVTGFFGSLLHSGKHESQQPDLGTLAADDLDKNESQQPDLGTLAADNLVTPTKRNFHECVLQLLINEKVDAPTSERNVFLLVQTFDLIYKKIRDQVCETGIGVSPIEIGVIQKIVGLVNTALKEIKAELDVFNVSLSKHVSSAFHTVNVLLLTKLYFKEQYQHFHNQLHEFTTKKEGLKNYFLRMVGCGKEISMDREFAQSSTDQIRAILEKQLRKEAQDKIDKSLEKTDVFTRENIQHDCDNANLNAADVDWHIKYITHPTEVIEKTFDVRWENKRKEINGDIANIRDQVAQTFSTYTEILRKILRHFTNDSTLESGTLFIDTSFKTSKGLAGENLINKGKCMAQVLYLYLTGQAIKTSYMEKDVEYELQNGDQYQLLPIVPESIVELMKDKELKAAYDQCSISNLFQFLGHLIDYGKKSKDELTSMTVDLINIDTKGTYKKLLDLARGCQNLCPCCNRPCDVNHSKTLSEQGGKYNKHNCNTGHQFRCMGGTKLEITNEASVKLCEEMNENDIIVTLAGKRLTWTEFKKEHDDWEFPNKITLESDVFVKRRTKFSIIWSKIGPVLCGNKDYYPDMVFVENNEAHPEHFILLLDNSGSMWGEPWKKLLEAVEKFIDIRKSSLTADHISIIMFGDSAKLACCFEDLKTFGVLSKIKEYEGKVGGGTAFGPPVLLISKAIETGNANKKSNKFVLPSIIFLADGEASFPQQELNSLKEKHRKNIVNFWSVGLGSTTFPILEQINNAMNGTFKNITDAKELVTLYAEMASAKPLKQS